MALVGELMEVIVYVQDMDAQVHFYCDVLGLSVAYPAGLADYSAEYWVTLNTGACILALHGGGGAAVQKLASKLVFRVSDINAARDALLERGVKADDVREAAPGVLVCDFFDPEGNPLSLEAHQH